MGFDFGSRQQKHHMKENISSEFGILVRTGESSKPIQFWGVKWTPSGNDSFVAISVHLYNKSLVISTGYVIFKKENKI